MEIQLIQKLNQTRIWHNPLLSLQFWLMMTSSEREDQTRFALLPGEAAPAAQLVPGAPRGFAQRCEWRSCCSVWCERSCSKSCCEGVCTSKTHRRTETDVTCVQTGRVLAPVRPGDRRCAWHEPELVLDRGWGSRTDGWISVALGLGSSSTSRHRAVGVGQTLTEVLQPRSWGLCGFHTPGTQLPGKIQQSPLTSHVSKYLQPSY